MRIAAYIDDRSRVPRLGVVVERHLIPIVGASGIVDVLDEGFEAAAERALARRGERQDALLKDVRLLAPVDRPGKILAVGLNYESHRAESPMRADPPPYPEGFVKLTSSVIGPDEPVVLWRDVEQLDYEVELAVVIGRTAHYVTVDAALEYVAGYTVANDISARDWQRSERSRGRSPVMGKSFPTFCPMGPWLVTTDEIRDPQALGLELRVNGEVRQSGSTADMIFTVAQAVSHWSKLRLDPGDVILTGTPAGVAWGRSPELSPYWLRVGDVIEAEIEQIGVLRNQVIAPP